MSGQFADRVRSATGKVWLERFDIGGFARFCRARHPLKTAACVADETGLPQDSVRKWLAGEVVPNGRALLALLCVYGPDLAHAMLNGAPTWMSSAARATRAARLHDEIAVRRAELETIEAAE